MNEYVHFLKKIAERLLYAHKKELPQRSQIKNILLDSYEPKITDWELAKIALWVEF